MKRYFRLAIWSFVVGAHLACAKQKFEAVPNQPCVEYNNIYGAGTCTLTPDGKNTFNYSVRFGDADVLFVVDNSGSMSFEHTEMADRFYNFINQLFSQLTKSLNMIKLILEI